MIHSLAGVICYDRTCTFCRRLVRTTAVFLRRHGYRFVPLQWPGVEERLGGPAIRGDEILLLRPGQASLGGADGLVAIATDVVPLMRFDRICSFPGVMTGLRRLYRLIARHRPCTRHQGAVTCGRNIDPEQMENHIHMRTR